jgi:protein tyrosine phosphatase (PTP) superfamily phosphohydrolase (DUF442 family)
VDSRAVVPRLTEKQIEAVRKRVAADPVISGSLLAHGRSGKETLLLFERELSPNERLAVERAYLLGLRDAANCPSLVWES